LDIKLNIKKYASQSYIIGYSSEIKVHPFSSSRESFLGHSWISKRTR
jgi:hypothetical protein